MNIRDTPKWKAIDLREEYYKATGRTTRQVDDYVQQLFNAQVGEWIKPIDHAYTKSSNKRLIQRIASRMKNEHGIEIEVRHSEKPCRIRIPFDEAKRLAKFRADQHEFYKNEMNKLYPNWKEI